MRKNNNLHNLFRKSSERNLKKSRNIKKKTFLLLSNKAESAILINNYAVYFSYFKFRLLIVLYFSFWLKCHTKFLQIIIARKMLSMVCSYPSAKRLLVKIYCTCGYVTAINDKLMSTGQSCGLWLTNGCDRPRCHLFRSIKIRPTFYLGFHNT